MNGIVFHSFLKRNRSQKNMNTIYFVYSYSRIVPKERALSIYIYSLSSRYIFLRIAHQLILGDPGAVSQGGTKLARRKLTRASVRRAHFPAFFTSSRPVPAPTNCPCSSPCSPTIYFSIFFFRIGGIDHFHKTFHE